MTIQPGHCPILVPFLNGSQIRCGFPPTHRVALHCEAGHDLPAIEVCRLHDAELAEAEIDDQCPTCAAAGRCTPVLRVASEVLAVDR